MSYYPRVEQETWYNYNPIDKRWQVYSTYPPHIRRLLDVAAITNALEDDGGRVISVDGSVDPNQVRLFKPR